MNRVDPLMFSVCTVRFTAEELSTWESFHYTLPTGSDFSAATVATWIRELCPRA
jgi:hypothetical protein